MWTASLERNFNGSRIVGHALERSSIYTTEWNESENVLNMSQPVPCPNHLEPHFMLNTCHFPNCTLEHLMVKMVQQDIGRSSLVMTAQPLRMLLPFPPKPTAKLASFIFILFNMSIPDTCDVEVLVPLLEVVELDVLEVLELDVPEVLEVVEDVDVWIKQKKAMLGTWHACWALLSQGTQSVWVLLEEPLKHAFMTLR